MWFTDEGTTPAIGRIGAGAPAASIAAPSVTGSGQQGTQQACQGDRWSDWAGQQPLLTTIPGYPAYQWSRDGTTIAGANSQSYTPVAADVGHSLRCTVTVTYALLGTTETATSAAVTVDPTVLRLDRPDRPDRGDRPPGARGQDRAVTCNTVRTTVTRKHKRVHVTKQACKTNLVSGPVKFTTASADQRASLSRAAVIYATGYAHRTRVGLQTSLIAARKLARGRYLLTLTSSHGLRRTASHEQVTIH
jgi:hypothetical protein